MPRLSVILPTRDRPDLLPRAVMSVVRQTMPDWELIVVDNNQRVGPVRGHPAASAWAGDRRVVVVEARDVHNAAAARNRGLAVARGEWIAYLDDDDAYRPEKLAAHARAGEAPVALCGAEYHLARRSRRVQCGPSILCGDDLLLAAHWGTPLLWHRRTDVRFDETLAAAEDAEFAHRLCARWHVDRVPVVAEPLVDLYPQAGQRVNLAADPLERATAAVLSVRDGFFSAPAVARFRARSKVAIAKLRGDRRATLRQGFALLRVSRGADWRVVANAWAVVFRVMPGRWVT